MSDVEKLKKLDPQEVYKRTYIAPKVLKALLEGDFARLGNRTKALGFVAILERELELDLGEIKEKIDEFYGIHQESSVFEIKEKEERRSFSWFWVIVAVLIAVAGYYFYTKSQQKFQKEPDSFLAAESNVTKTESNASEEENRSSAQTVETNETVSYGVLEDTNESNDYNASGVSSMKFDNVEERNESNVSEESNATQELEAMAPETLTFIPKKKLWLGIIYLDDYSRKNYVTSSPVEINTSRDQLIVTGHGLFEVEHNNKIEDFKDRGKQRFIYRAGELEKIDATTFKRYNKGKDW
jgi:cytoskeletal protein RodZ